MKVEEIGVERSVRIITGRDGLLIPNTAKLLSG
jgi:hypothetical protein